MEAQEHIDPGVAGEEEEVVQDDAAVDETVETDEEVTATDEVVEEEVDETPEPDVDLKAEIAELKQKNKKLENRQFYLERTVKQKSRAKPLPEIPKSDTTAPNPDNFTSQEDFEAAQRKHEIALEVNARIDEYNKGVASQVDAADLQSFAKEVVDTGMEKYEDFQELINQPLPITDEMIIITQELDNPADIWYYLMKHPAELTSISRMGRVQTVRALTDVEAKVKQALDNPQAEGDGAEHTPKPTPKKKVTKAPAPVKPIKKKGATTVIAKDPNKMSQQEYEQWRAQGGG